MWTKIEDHKVRHLWECPECDRAINVEPWWYSEYGLPICVSCPDQDMEYIRTEIVS
jgi:hypothetical protein